MARTSLTVEASPVSSRTGSTSVSVCSLVFTESCCSHSRTHTCPNTTDITWLPTRSHGTAHVPPLQTIYLSEHNQITWLPTRSHGTAHTPPLQTICIPVQTQPKTRPDYHPDYTVQPMAYPSRQYTCTNKTENAWLSPNRQGTAHQRQLTNDVSMPYALHASRATNMEPWIKPNAPI